MNTSESAAALEAELRVVEEDLARLRETSADLRRRIGEREDEPTDPAERSALIEQAEEQEALIDMLKARREELLGNSVGPGPAPGRSTALCYLTPASLTPTAVSGKAMSSKDLPSALMPQTSSTSPPMIMMPQFTAFPDALRFVLNVKTVGIRVAAASSSKNADLLLQQVRLDTFAAEHHLDSPLIRPGLTLLGLLAADVSGRDLPRGKPDPLIFVTAASEIGAVPGRCFVAEDAVSGVQAAKAGGMAALGVALLGDEMVLRSAGADLVVRTGVPQR